MGKKESVPNRQYTDEFKVEAVRLGESIGGNKAAARLGVPESSMWNWIGLGRAGKLRASNATAELVKRSIAEVEAENARLRRELASTKLDLEIVKKRRRISRRSRGEVRLDRRAKRLVQRSADVPPAWCVAHGLLSVEDTPAERAFDGQCDARCAGCSNSRRQQAQLRMAKNCSRLNAQGVQVSHERVRSSLKRQDLRPVYKRPYRVTTDSAHKKPIAPNVLDRRFDGWQVNQAWVADITYVATHEGWLYLACVMDMASRRIVGWSMSERMKAGLVCEALKSAYWRRKPPAGVIVHSDRGSQYASDEYRKLIKDYRMIQSMSRQANCWDNAAMESFFKSLKVERVHSMRYDTRALAKLDIVDWIEGFYNQKRMHSSIDYQTPVKAEYSLKAA